MNPTPVKRKVEQTIKNLLRKEVGRFGITTISVTPGEDHDGDPVIFVDVDYGPVGDDIDTKVLAGLVYKVREQLWKLGEERFPHIRHNIGDERRLEEHA
jgi:hypothetical protein